MPMFSLERRLLTWLERFYIPLSFLAVTLISLLIRYGARDFLTPDARDCLLPWYDTIKDMGGIRSLSTQVGDYNMLYQFLIALLTYLPIPPLYAYKLLSVLFDYVAAAGVGLLASFAADKGRKKAFALLGYSLTVLWPIVFLNSAWWSQCDGIFTAFVLLSLAALCRDRYCAAFLLYGVALSFKLQAIFVLPFFFLAYVVKKRFSLLNFLFIPLVMIVTALPNLAMGRSIPEIFTIYLDQTASYGGLYFNYPSFWALFFPPFSQQFPLLKATALLFTLGVLILLLSQWLLRRIPLTPKNTVYLAFLTCYTCVLFLPCMHERYGYLCEVLAIVLLFYNRKTAPALAALTVLSLGGYGHYLFEFPLMARVGALVNLAAYVAYLYLLHRDLDRTAPVPAQAPGEAPAESPQIRPVSP